MFIPILLLFACTNFLHAMEITPEMRAKKGELEQRVRTLIVSKGDLDEFKANAERTDWEILPPLLETSQSDYYLESTKELLKHNADPNIYYPKCLTLISPLYNAVTHNALETFKALLESGADCTRDYLAYGNLVNIITSSWKWQNTDVFFKTRLQMLKLVLARNASPNYSGSDQRTPLIQLAADKSAEMSMQHSLIFARRLLYFGAHTQLKDKHYDKISSQWARENNYTELAELIEHSQENLKNLRIGLLNRWKPSSYTQLPGDVVRHIISYIPHDSDKHRVRVIGYGSLRNASLNVI